MTTRGSNHLDAQRHATRRPGISAISSYLVAGVIHAILISIAQTATVQGAFLRLGWKLGPWPSVPFPYDFTDYVAGTYLYNVVAAVSVFVTMALALTLAVAGVHSLIFGVVLVAHIWFGWPRYWKDMRSRITLSAVWAASAKRCWWAWPAGQLIWILLDQLAWGLQYAQYPLIDNGPPFLAANILAIGIMFAGITARVIRASITQAIDLDDVRCGRCGYLLRGLTEKRCPECGYDGHLGGKVEYALRRQRSEGWMRVRRVLAIGLTVALLLAPILLPLGLRRVPRQWLRSIPKAIRLDYRLVNPNQGAFPIRLDAICVIRHESSLAVVRFQPKNVFAADYKVAYWSDVNDARIQGPPDSVSDGQVPNGRGPFLPIGPWRFHCRIGDRNMLWLTRPDDTYSVEAFEPDGLPSELAWRSPSNWSGQQSQAPGEQ